MRALDRDQLTRLADDRRKLTRLLLRVATCATPFYSAVAEATCILVLAHKAVPAVCPDVIGMLDAAAFVALEEFWDAIPELPADLRDEIEVFLSDVLTGGKLPNDIHR